jgi:hypothetical protein
MGLSFINAMPLTRLALTAGFIEDIVITLKEYALIAARFGENPAQTQ